MYFRIVSTDDSQTKRGLEQRMHDLKNMMENERVNLENEMHARISSIQSHYERERVLMVKQVGEAHKFVLYLATKCDTQ